METARLLTFAGLWFVLGFSPGPNAAYCVATGLSYNLKKALAAPTGMGLASFVHVTVAVVGAGAVLSRSPAVFQTLKFGGVAYLTWLGVKQWRSNNQVLGREDRALRQPSFVEVVRSAMIVSVTNPKAVLQYIAVLPQFVVATKPAAPQFAALALIAAAVTFANYTIYTVAASGIARKLNGRRIRALNRAIAAVYVLAALILAAK